MTSDPGELGIIASTLSSPPVQSESVYDGVTYRWRGSLSDEEMVELVTSHGGNAEIGWWDRIRRRSFGWVTARNPEGDLVGFVNVVTDGGDHAFILDAKTRGGHRRKGIGTRTVWFATTHAKAAGCEWLHVDFESHLAPFYFDACGFRPTAAGLIHLPSLND